MKLLNYNELKTILLEERDKIPLTVPGARYEMYLPQPNRHGESMRAGIRIALRCMERCQPVLTNEARPHGRWERDENEKVRCSVCKKKALEAKKGVWYVPNFCPHCGADMRGGGEDG